MNLNCKMTVYEKPIDDIILTGKKLKTHSLRSDTRQEGPLLPLLFNIVLKVLVRVPRKSNKGILIRKKNINLSV